MIGDCMSYYSIGVDLGGTNLRAAAIDDHGKMLDKIGGSTHLKGGRDAVIADMVQSIETFARGRAIRRSRASASAFRDSF